ncbi:MAG TPA: hypothetical protein VGD17_11260 [Chitinophagaceae bacterium]
MVTQIEFFRNELKDWDKSLKFYDDEILVLENRLQEVVTKNTRTSLLAEAEHFQNQFILQKEQFDLLLHDINERKATIETSIRERKPLVNGQASSAQEIMRSNMLMTEKIFIETRQEFYRFLSRVL